MNNYFSIINVFQESRTAIKSNCKIPLIGQHHPFMLMLPGLYFLGIQCQDKCKVAALLSYLGGLICTARRRQQRSPVVLAQTHKQAEGDERHRQLGLRSRKVADIRTGMKARAKTRAVNGKKKKVSDGGGDEGKSHEQSQNWRRF